MGQTPPKPGRTNLPPSAQVTALPPSMPPADNDPRAMPPLTAVKPGSTFGKYKLNSLLGSGAMGQVYSAYDTLIRRNVAIKVMHPEMTRDRLLIVKLLDEARAAATLNHPNVVTVFDVEQVSGSYCVVMELVGGGSLQEYLQRRGSPGWRAATRLIGEACLALSSAHESGMIHRDIKPSNLMLTREGRVKVADFGLAKMSGPDSPIATQAGAILGTPAYMSPEQCRGETIDHRADIYSLGCTYFALLTGKLPFESSTSAGAMVAHCSSPIPDPREMSPQTPPACVEIVRKAMAKDVKDRYGSAREMLEDLKGVLAGGAARDGGGKWKWSLAAAAALMIGVGAWIWRTSQGPRENPTQLSGAMVPATQAGSMGFSQAATAPANADAGKRSGLPLGFTASTGQQMKLIKAGVFVMGDSLEADNLPHAVTLTRPFYIAITHVTVAQFREFVNETKFETSAEQRGWGDEIAASTGQIIQVNGANWRNPGFKQDDVHPVVEVSWNDGVNYCNWLTRREGRLYRLPTEAEFEYSCRAGASTRFWWGNSADEGAGKLNGGDQATKAYFSEWPQEARFKWNDGYIFTSPVGKFKPNAWGLYDMTGNVNEWCSDWYAPIGKGAVIDPAGPANGQYRIAKGSSWGQSPITCRCGTRFSKFPNMSFSTFGFRVVCDVPVAMTPATAPSAR